MLTERGRRFLEHYLQLHTRPAPAGTAGAATAGADTAGHSLCPVTADDLVPVARKLAEVYRRHPAALAPARAAEDSLARALVLCAHGALRGKAVIVLGDSDLASLAIGLLGQALRDARRSVGMETLRICVVETDPS